MRRKRRRPPGLLTSSPLRLLAGLAVTTALAVAAGCSSTPVASKPTIPRAKGRPAVPATTSTTTTTSAPPTAAPASTTTTAIQTSSVTVQIAGASATIQFVSSNITGSLAPGTGSFSQGNTVYTFPVTGVAYSGAPATTTASGGLITSVTVAAASGGVTVTVQLSSAASRASLGLGHNEVGVQFS